MPWRLVRPWPGLTHAYDWDILQLFYYICALAKETATFALRFCPGHWLEHIRWLGHTQVAFKDMLFKALLPFGCLRLSPSCYQIYFLGFLVTTHHMFARPQPVPQPTFLP